MFQALSRIIFATLISFSISMCVGQFALADGGGGGGGADVISEPTFKKPKNKKKITRTKQRRKAKAVKNRKTKATPAQRAPQRTAIRKAKRAPKTASRRVARIPRVIESSTSGLPPSNETRYINDEVIVRFRLTSTNRSRSQAVAASRLQHLEARSFLLAGVTVHRYRILSGEAVSTVIAALENNAAVVNAQPNYLYTLQQSAPAKLKQYANDQLGIAGIHGFAKGARARIAIIDSAIINTHPEIENASLVTYDVSDSGSGNIDSHGTSMAGILVADGKLTGVAPAAEIIGIAAFAKTSEGKVYGNSWTISEALNVALAQKAKILNLSFAGPPDPLIERGMEGAKKRNMLPIAAAGNDGPDAKPLYPAAYRTVFATTAVDIENKIYSHANQGDYIEFSAPGVQILTVNAKNGFDVTSGTSLATAYMSGVAALIVSMEPEITYAQFARRLREGAFDLGSKGRDTIFGFGMPRAIDVVNAIAN